MTSTATEEKTEAASAAHMEYENREQETKTNESLVEVEVDPITKRKKRHLLLKIDLFILPLIALVYFFASMVSLPSLRYACFFNVSSTL